MKVIRKASGAFQAHLSANISKLRSSSSIIISSAPSQVKDDTPQKTDQELKIFQSKIERNCAQVHFFPTMQFNLKTIAYGEKTLTSAYPQQSNVNEVIELMTRTGVTNIIGVGNGAAIDLAKACYYKRISDDHDDDIGELILNPSTLGAIGTAASEHCLLLDTEEEALMPTYSPSTINKDAQSIIIDESSISIPSWLARDVRNKKRRNIATITDNVLASLVVALDAAHAMGDGGAIEEGKISCLNECIQSSARYLSSIQNSPNDFNVAENQEFAVSAVLNAGQLLSFGQENSLSRRNVAVALTASILPKYFPHGNWSTFTASLLPGVVNAINKCDEGDENEILIDSISTLLNLESQVSPSHLVEWFERLDINSTSSGVLEIPSLSSLSEGAPGFSELLTKIEDHGTFTQCIDADSEYLENILVSSLNR